MTRPLVLVVSGTNVQIFTPGQPQMPEIVTDTGEKGKWTFSRLSSTKIAYDRGLFAPMDADRSGCYVTVIDQDSRDEIRKAMSEAVRLLQRDIKNLLDISPFA